MQTIKLNAIDRWKRADGNLLTFEGVGARRIRLHLNSPGVALAWLVHDEGDPQFLGRVEGYQTIEFYAAGSVKIGIEGSDVWWSCAEVEPTFVEVIDPVIFTRIANRRHRNPELEEMMFRMQQNMERRLAQQAGEIEAAFERRRREEEHGRPAEIVQTVAPGAAANAGGTEVRPPEPVASQPGESAGGAGGGEQPGDGNGGPA